MILRRLAVCAVGLVGLAAFAAPDGKYTIDFPSGWSAAEVDRHQNAESQSSDGRFWCRSNSNVMASLANSTQAHLNNEYKDPWTAETWAAVLSVPEESVSISEATAQIVDGHVVQKVTILFNKETFGDYKKARVISHVLVGRMTNAACFAPADEFKSVKPVFDQVINSLKPV